MKKAIWISDLTHTAQGIGANGFPLGQAISTLMLKKFLGMNLISNYLSYPLIWKKNLEAHLQLYLVFLTIVGIWN